MFFALPLVPDMAILHGAHPDRLGRRSRLYAAVSRGWVGAPPQRRVLNGAMGLIAIMIIPLAVSVHSVLSRAFALVSRLWWHESIWAPYFVVAALYSGVALVILVLAGFRRAYHLEHFITERHFVRLGFILAAFAAAYLYLAFADILPAAYVGEQGPSIVFHELLVGHFAVWFWMFVVVAGVLPLLLVALPTTRTVTGMVVAAAFVVPAMWLKRMIMVVDPSTYDQMTHTFGVYHFTWISVSITLAGAAAIPLLLMLLFRVVPLLAIDEIEELAGTGGELAASTDGHRPVTPSADGHRRTRLRWFFRSGGAATAVLLAVGAVSLATPTHASAETSEPPPAVITLTGTEQPDGIHLTATVTDSRGTPLPGAKVEFFEITTTFGPQGQQVSLGSVVTDGGGVATLTDQPTITGARRYAAGYRGGEQAASASANIDVQVKVAHPAYQPAPAKPLATVGKGLVGVLLTTVVLVLITLAAQVVRVVRVCRGGLHVGGSRSTTG